ncbi:hypothetical protein [Paenibacillus luteus]|uniref:hypothetical protein n=1 Tax=Paenibacillus luteus TaxID=2545753 RepID=UPI001142B960|nr:hypothetical protein [Paenibacillus luteus]
MLEIMKNALQKLNFGGNEGIEVSNNCPECKTGVMEPIGFFEVKSGPMSLYFGRDAPDNQPAINMLMCSKEICGCIRFAGVPGTLRIVNELRRSIQKKEIYAIG